MVDLSPFKSRIETARASAVIDYDDPRAAFLDELRAAGFTPPKLLTLGKLMRFADPYDKKGKESGWAIYHEFTNNDSGKVIGVGNYGSWHGFPEKVIWSSKSVNGLTSAEKAEYNRQVEAARVLRDEEQRVLQAQAAQKAFEIWQGSPDVTAAHEYLTRKMVVPFAGIKLSRGDIVIPVCVGEEITSLQFIKPNGEKKFLPHGRLKGCYYKLEGTDEGAGVVYIAEGFSTAASVWMATHDTVYIAFNAGNLYEVASAVKAMHPDCKIVICADDDTESAGNAGRTKAIQAGQGLGLDVVFAGADADGVVINDMNDLHCTQGLDALRTLLTAKPATYKKKKKAITEQADDVYRPRGILGEIVNYYHATSGNKQVGFAVQTAIAACSVMLSRNFETNYSNRTSLFLMNIALSSTGKEHGKKVIELILEATSNGHLISGDGYTSGAAVISALQERPRHITIIDEFSKYLQAANNKYGNSHLMEANSQLMQAISRLDGTMRARSYATIGQTKDRKKELANQIVVNPAVTMIGMTTPDDMFQTIDLRSIKDGFLNRFIICVSDAERAIREHKEPIDVPQSIIEWASIIRQRHGDSSESATEAPTVVKLIFSQDALEQQKEFQQFCIDRANELEQYGMSEISGRSNEMSMRLALIVALSRDPMAEVILQEDMAWAIEWVKINLVALVERLKMSVSASEHEGFKKEILKALRERDGGVTWAQMQKQAPFSKHKAKDLSEMLKSLQDADLAFSEPYNSGGKGRPTMLWKASE